jgi:hypothetical protein
MLVRVRSIQPIGSALAPALFIAALGTCPPVSAAETAGSWLPLERSALIEVLSQGAEANPPTVQTLDEYLAQKHDASKAEPTPSEKADSPTIAASKRLAPDTIWLVYGPEFPFWVAMAGDGERIHSVRITVPVVNHSAEENDRAFSALSDLFKRIYPQASDADTWPKLSLGAAWNNHPLARKEPLSDPDEVFFRRSANGITSSTFGVPPDIVVYDITVRENCIPAANQGNPFKRIIC